MSEFKEKSERIYHALKKAQAKLGEKFNLFTDKDKKLQSDDNLNMGVVLNTSKTKIKITRDTRFDDYVKEFNRPLVKKEIFLNPGECVLLPNKYIVFWSLDGKSRVDVMWILGEEIKKLKHAKDGRSYV